MLPFEWQHAAFLALAIVLEIAANIFLKLSDGFRKVWLGMLSLISVLAAFSALAQAVKGIDLTVAYALWGGFGIAATVAAGWILFGQRLNKSGWVGLGLLLLGMVLIKLA
ncbi:MULTISPECIES: multidrug/spermidine efflux SMR transporter subunit MdtI [unclassified Symbiopectobacterium]|uniref:multidrug/spermidine efflux SMR transporter subunit MdtI n=1 Tax=unclassified Symbiopectobacterium TaxID=2794573 RepID=UPI002227C894|nr:MULTISPECIES: multidrug/spermidine efflux SMR transporter subunit MdtI [unclassified Symbiopectobacterium]MCW2474811.1 multidrug/spermidine efflux SMR transporter subunit MdtI [Candidatus Symbiopectobacterium sp. NZEC151]MCW2482761.1 multidrug/spermidine efflux SMR transporter subunit MdtI [Candidatus Symbiopectobacterium sp. NZEC135]MCW2487461.1 multidrug/spermidine efflux SMR transporter subunit MdtI [Candidatus Symbiopectobacterium sp. NZEC127]